MSGWRYWYTAIKVVWDGEKEELLDMYSKEFLHRQESNNMILSEHISPIE